MIEPHVRLVERLVGEDELPPHWREAFAAVPRHLFLPDEITDPCTGAPVDRLRSERWWLEAAYADVPVVTQVDDGARYGPGVATSSAPAPSEVAATLRALAAEPGMRVLEVGTGSGYTAALLAHRLGDEAVTSMEIDFELAEQARVRLMSAGLIPLVVSGDGMTGWAGRAPYDRVLSSVAVRRVPYAWVAQTQPGGRVLTPWGTSFHRGALVDLEVESDGTAHGRFVGHTDRMWARAQRPPRYLWETYVRPGVDEAVSTRSRLHPGEVVGDSECSFAVGLRMPDVHRLVRLGDEPEDPRFTVYLMNPSTWSWASWHIDPEHRDAGYEVRQYGPRRLFDELEAAHLLWVEAGRPAHTRFGLTVSAERQSVWLDDEAEVIASTR